MKSITLLIASIPKENEEDFITIRKLLERYSTNSEPFYSYDEDKVDIYVSNTFKSKEEKEEEIKNIIKNICNHEDSIRHARAKLKKLGYKYKKE